MMYAKLALRNVKRSAKDYLIYVITLILSVGLFYGFMSIASPYYNESLPVKINLEILNKAMRIAVPIVALLVVFLISYVNTYMLRRKQKEFAVQTIIGMEQRTVAFIFFVETMIMGAISIIFGILLGIGLSQIVGYIVVQSFGVEWQPYLSLFPDTILFTLLFFGAIFIVMGIRNIRTVRQLKIIDMLHSPIGLPPVKNISNTCSFSSSWIPRPLSLTHISAIFSRGIAVIRMFEPAGVYLTALFTKLISTCMMSPASTRTSSGSSPANVLAVNGGTNRLQVRAGASWM